MEQTQIASFVIRFHLAEVNEKTNKKRWRIKVTHVQEDDEMLFETVEEATLYMQRIVDNF